ncbi:MAG: HAD-IA family hydrolase [Candidatus Zixiibacteriota bacterium]|jgi:putative hydrolase of the HAD superfamily
MSNSDTKYRAVIFDLFGTLVEIFSMREYEALVDEMCEVLGVAPADFMARWDEKADARTRGEVTVRDSLFRLCRDLGVDVTAEQVERAAAMRVDFVRRVLVPRDDAVATLAALRERGFKLALISDCSEEVVEAWPGSELAAHFDVAILSAEVGLKKPSPEIYGLATDGLGVEAGACLYVGDGGSRELTGAEAVGMDALMIRPADDAGAFRRDADEWDGPRISALTEILALVG